METNEMNREIHPLEPFLPAGARLLMLGSFPPKRERWSMEFYYPNLQNDMWRIVGLVFFADKERFLSADRRRFERKRIAEFCRERGIALCDTAREVIRLRDNASDKFLEVVSAVDLPALLARIPRCSVIVVTGQKAAQTLVSLTGCREPAVGEAVECRYADRALRIYRMPSSSRAYPLALERKAEIYGRMFREAGLLE